MLEPIMSPDRQTIEEFVRQPTPRKVSDEFMKRISPDGAGNKGCLAVLLLYFLFTLIFVLKAVPWMLPVEIWVRLTSSGTAEGVITRYEDSNTGWRAAISGGKRGNPQKRSYRLYITYPPGDGRRVEIKNYVTGLKSIPGYSDASYDNDGRAVKKVPVSVRFSPVLEKWALADGGRLSVYSLGGLFILIFPYFALLIYREMERPRKRLIKILTIGRPAVADLVSFREYVIRRKRGSVTYAETIFSFSLDGLPLQAEYHIRRERASDLEQTFKNQKKYLILYQAGEPEPVLPLIRLDDPADTNGPEPVDPVPNRS